MKKKIFFGVFFLYCLLLIYNHLPKKNRYVGIYTGDNKKLELNKEGWYKYWLNDTLICEGKWVAINKLVEDSDSDIELTNFRKSKERGSGYTYFVKSNNCLYATTEFPPEFCKE